MVHDFDALGEGAEVVAAVAAAGDAHAFAGGGCEFADHVWADGLVRWAFESGLGAFGVGACLVADSLQTCDAVALVRLRRRGS